MKIDEKFFMSKAVEAALEAMNKDEGGPFGAVVVKDNNIVGFGKNQVNINTDPSAHAEVMAIRNACKNLNSLDLSGCILFSSCEPCPMCLGAIYWAKLDKVYYGCSIIDSSSIGFEDKHIYNQIDVKKEDRQIPFIQIHREIALEPFQKFINAT